MIQSYIKLIPQQRIMLVNILHDEHLFDFVKVRGTWGDDRLEIFIKRIIEQNGFIASIVNQERNQLNGIRESYKVFRNKGARTDVDYAGISYEEYIKSSRSRIFGDGGTSGTIITSTPTGTAM